MNVVEYTEFLVKNIVKKPEMVKVELFESDEETSIVEIIVHPDDMGAVIGKAGRTATSLRTLIQAYAYINHMPKLKINIDSF